MLFPYGGAYSHSPIPQLEQDMGMGQLFPPPPPHTHTHTQTGNPGSITEIECTLLSGSAEQDALTMKESPLKNLILFFLRPHPSWGWLQMTNSFCCFYLLFLYQSLHHHLLLKCLTLAPTTYMYYMYVLVYSLLHICDSMAGHWTTSPPCLQVVKQVSVLTRSFYHLRKQFITLLKTKADI